MKPAELYDILMADDGLDEAYTGDIHAVQNAIVRALNIEEVKALVSGAEHRCPLDSRRLIKLQWMVENPSGSGKPEVRRNEPLYKLIRLYTDKKSGRVEDSRKELRQRYPYQGYADQKKIVSLMLGGSKADRLWACRRIAKDQIPGFEDDLRREWESMRVLPMAWMAMRYLPKEYILTQIDELRQAGVEMHEICSHLGNLEGFPYEVTPDLVAPEHYIQTMVKLGRIVPQDQCRELIRTYLCGRCRDMLTLYLGYDCLSAVGKSLSDICPFREIVRALGKLGYVDLLKELFDLSVKVAEHSPDTLHDVCRTVLRELMGEDAPIERNGCLAIEGDMPDFLGEDEHQ